MTISERFEKKFIKRNEKECWPWIAFKSNGYGKIKVGNSTLRAHRLSWILHYGEIPKGLHVLHTCDNPSCVNPNHLWLGTDADNMADRDRKNRHIKCEGEKNGRAKLTEKDVLFIRNSKLSTIELSNIFPICKPHINRIKSGRKWKHIKEAV